MHNGIKVLSIRGLKICQNLLTFVLLAHFTGIESFGYYTVILSLATSIIVISYCGLEQLAQKIIVEQPQHIGQIYLIKVFLASFFSLCLFLVVSKHFPTVENEFLLFIVVATILNSDSLGFTYFNSKQELSTLLRTSFFIFIISCFLKIGAFIASNNILFYMILIFDVVAPATVLMILVSRNGDLINVKKEFLFRFLKSNIKKMMPLWISVLIIQTNLRFDSIVLSSYFDGETLSSYAISLKVNELFAVIVSSVILANVPAFFKEQTDDGLYRIMQRIILNFVLIYATTAILLAIISYLDLINIFSNDYDFSFLPTFILITGTIFGGVSSLFGYWFIYKGLESQRMYRALVGLACTVIFSFVLVPKFGVLGAALSSLLTGIIVAIFANLISFPTRAVLKNVFLKIRA